MAKVSKQVRRAITDVMNPFIKPDVKQFNIVDMLKINDDDIDRIMIEVKRGFGYYNYNNSVKDAKIWFLKYLNIINTEKNIIKIIKSAPDWCVSMTMGSLAKMLTDGLPLLPEFQIKINKAIQKIVNQTELIKLEKIQEQEKNYKNKLPIISIQERMVEKMNHFLGEFVENELDDMINNNGKSCFKLSKILDLQNIPGKQAKLIALVYQVELDLITEVLTIKRPVNKDMLDQYLQLHESYDYPKHMLKKMQNFYQNLVDDAEHHAIKMKTMRKKRIRKVPSVEKMVAKVKYKTSDDLLKLVSIDPSKIIGAKEVWLYNTKIRKLIKVVASEIDGNALTIQGTTIHCYCNSKSIQKTLRKPEQQLMDFQNSGKIKLRTFIEDIKTTSVHFNGRLNKHIVILKAI